MNSESWWAMPAIMAVVLVVVSVGFVALTVIIAAVKAIWGAV